MSHTPGRVGCWGSDSSLVLGVLFILKPPLGTFFSPPVCQISLPSILYIQTGSFQADSSCQTETRVAQRWLKFTQPGFPSLPCVPSSTCVSLPWVEQGQYPGIEQAQCWLVHAGEGQIPPKTKGRNSSWSISAYWCHAVMSEGRTQEESQRRTQTTAMGCHPLGMQAHLCADGNTPLTGVLMTEQHWAPQRFFASLFFPYSF